MKNININYGNIPNEMKELKQFVCFDIEDGKKIPFTPDTNHKARSNDSATWRSFDEAMADLENGKRQYLGFCVSEDDPYVFFDLDHTDVEEEIENSQEVFDVFNSFSEKSISGKGRHIIAKGALEGRGIHTSYFGLFDRCRFILLTGDIIDGRDTVRRANSKRLKRLQTHTRSSSNRGYNFPLEEKEWDMPYWALYNTAMSVYKQKFIHLMGGEWKAYNYPSQSEADHALISMLSEFSESNSLVRYLFAESGLYREWKGGGNPRSYIDRSIQNFRSMKKKKGIDKFTKRNRDNLTVKSGEYNIAKYTDNSAKYDFPIASTPKKLRDLIQSTAKATDTPLAISAIYCMGILSTSLGGGLLALNRNRETYPNIYALIVASSGTGKSVVFEILARVLHRLQSSIRAKQEANHLELNTEIKIKESRVAAILKLAAKGTLEDDLANEMKALDVEIKSLTDKVNRKAFLMAGEATEARLEVMLSMQPYHALGILIPDARNLFKTILGRHGNNKYGGEEQLYLCGYSRDPYQSHRVSRGDTELHPILTMTLAVQDDLLQDICENSSMTESGLLPRFLIYQSKDRIKPRPKESIPVDIKALTDWENLIEELVTSYRHATTPQQVKFSNEASDAILEEDNNKRARKDPVTNRYDSYLARYGENLIKITTLLHVAIHGGKSHEIKVDLKTTQHAIEIARWFLNEQEICLQEGRTKIHRSKVEKLYKILQEAENKTEKVRKLVRSHGFDSEEQIRHLVDSSDCMEVVKVINPKGGRPSFKAKIIKE